MSEVLLSAENIHKKFAIEERELHILRGLDLTIHKGEAVCIVGGSGAGKSTFLHLLGGLDEPTEGKIEIDGVDISQMKEDKRAEFRNQNLGFVFQFHHLLTEFTALENVLMPKSIAGEKSTKSKQEALELLTHLGVADRAQHYPSQLSGGEQQRVAIARALIQKPKLILADEPTGNLDSKNDLIIQDLFFKLCKEYSVTLLVVTHSSQFAERFPRKLEMKDGSWL